MLYLAVAVALVAGAMVTTSEAASSGWKFRINAGYADLTTAKEDLDFAVDSDQIGDVYAIDPDSDGAFRLGFEAMTGQVTYFIQYTDYEVEEDESLRSNNDFSGTLLLDDFTDVSQDFPIAKAAYDQDYSMWSAGVRYQLRPGEKFGVEVIGGFMMASIEENFDVVYANGAATEIDLVFQTNDTDAFGFNMGLVPSYMFNEYVTLFGRFNYSPMMADTDRTFEYRSGGSGASSATRDVLLTEGDEGIAHRTDFAVGVDVTPVEWLILSVGYENETWLNYEGFLKYTSESGEETIDRGSDDLSFDGWFFQAGFKF